MTDDQLFLLSRREFFVASAGAGLLLAYPGVPWAGGKTPSTDVEPQPWFAHIKRIINAMHEAGEPMAQDDEKAILALADTPTQSNINAAETVLGRYTLMNVRLDKKGIGESWPGSAKRELVEQGWRTFLIRVENTFGLQQAINIVSDARNPYVPALTGASELASRSSLSAETHYIQQHRIMEPADVAKHWMNYNFFSKHPMNATLSGLGVEYQVIQVYSRDAGRKSAWLGANSASAPWIPTYGLKKGFQADFNCLPSRDYVLDIKDWDAKGVMASLIIRDQMERLYPAIAQRLEPDFDFQPQVYRADGESLRLPAGRYTITAWRGPEYLKSTQQLVLGSGSAQSPVKVRLQRWINAAALGWYPGDTHVHAAGCSHYEIPTMGVTPETMIRHVRGEALTVGDVLTWAPGFYYQKQFFTGHVHQPENKLGHPAYQKANNVSLEPKATSHDHESMVRYDIEVSGFPSSHSGHLVLLRLKQQEYPGTAKIADWPSWNLPILKWAKSQGAVVGYAHSALGMSVNSNELPNYKLPALNGIGANEYVVDLAHDAVDFTSGAEFRPAAELNYWYHTLNCGFRGAMVGETDFPCISDERVGTGRTYVGLEKAPVGDEGFTQWTEGIKRGRLYFGDGRSHFVDYRINGRDVGGDDPVLTGPGTVRLTAKIAARLEETPIDADDENLTPKYAYWHLERARIGATRKVPLEVVVNGRAVATREILADGNLRDFSIDVQLDQSAWVALRILPSGHTHPIFVSVAGKPVRASKRSAQWCLDYIDVLWKEKGHRIRASERPDAKAAYDYARTVYKRIKQECTVD